MKLIASLSMIFCFCIGVGLSNGQTTNNVFPELAAARAKYDTPFIKKYRPRYEANNINLRVGVIAVAFGECIKHCSKNDKKIS